MLAEVEYNREQITKNMNKRYRYNPKTLEYVKKRKTIRELLASISVYVLAIIVLLFCFSEITKRKATRKFLQQETEYAKHIENLNEISHNLKIFQTFISEQKQKLSEEQIALESLMKEKDKLSSLVESDRKIVDSLFLEQEKRQRRSKWHDQLFGFSLGILGSLIASLIYRRMDERKKRHHASGRGK